MRVVLDHQSETPTQWKAIESLPAKVDVNHETRRQWVCRAQTDAGARPGFTADEPAQMKGTQEVARYPPWSVAP